MKRRTTEKGMSERVARIERTGGPEVIEWVDRDLPDPGHGEVRMRNEAVGLNYIDTYHRSGVYPVDLPSGLGSEAAGVIEAVGPGVEGFAAGDRVGCYGKTLGAYATARNLPADEVVHLPDGVDARTAAALLLKGSTALMLVERCAKVERGQRVLVWAAAGGVGHLLTGWLREIGASVIGIVGSADKAERAQANGAEHVIRHDSEDVAERVRAITDGEGVPVILDGVGKASWRASLNNVARRGLIVSYGNASGTVEGVALGTLASKGSIFVTRPTLFDYAPDRAAKQAMADRVFQMLAKRAITAEIGQSFALQDAADAHRAIEAGETHGSTLLIA